MFILFIIESWTHLRNNPALFTMGFPSKVAHSTMSYFFWLHKLFGQQWKFPKGIWYMADALWLFIVSYKREFVKLHPKRHMGYYGRTLMLLLHHSLWQDTLVWMTVYRYKCCIGKFSSDNLENFELLCFVFRLTLHQSGVML